MNNNFLLDIHTHTIMSGHAYGTIRENAKAAKDANLLLLGTSEHAPGITGTCHPIYFSNMYTIPRFIDGVEILRGCEVNVLNDGTISLEEKYMKHLDYLIAGIHDLCYKNEGKEKNTLNLISCMKHPKVFFVSHPDSDHLPLDYPMLIEACKKYHVALELNNSSLTKPDKRINCFENYHTILTLCKKEQLPIIVNTDAHDPSQVGDFTLAKKLLEEENFPSELILNTNIEKFKQFISHTG